MQTTDSASDPVVSPYPDRRYPTETLKPYSKAMQATAPLVAWLVPGAGHLILGRYGRALLFFGLLVGTFVLGLAIHGRLFWPAAAEPPSTFSVDLISVLWFFAQIGSGLCYGISYITGFGTHYQPQAATFEYGNTFTFLAGLLNYLVAYDAYDIAAGRKR